MLGCTNYKRDGTGCSRMMGPKYFYEYMNIKDDTPAEPIKIPRGYDTKQNDSAKAEKRNKTSNEDYKGVCITAPDIKPVLYRGKDLNKILVTILQTLSDISKKKYYGVTVLINVLRGSKDNRIISGNLDIIDGYGKLSDIDRADIKYIIEWLIKKNFILQTKGQYPVLHPTYNGTHYGEIMTSQQLHALRKELEKIG